jgi:hypothetical protein
MLSREEMRTVERALANGEQDTRDEIGFLLLHQGFADRFFPGTSVLHTRLRYVLFVPWLYEDLANSKKRGRDLGSLLRERMLMLARRLKAHGDNQAGVIGGDLVGEGRLSSQPPNLVYWSALKRWELLLRGIATSNDALRRIQLRAHRENFDDDGAPLEPDDVPEVFCGLPPRPPDWEDETEPLSFEIPERERRFLRDKLRVLCRPDDQAALLAKLVAAKATFAWDPDDGLPEALDDHADAADRRALAVARDAAHLAAIGRLIYGALVEWLREEDGASTDDRFRSGLVAGIQKYGDAAACCDLGGIYHFVPNIPEIVRNVLSETQRYLRAGTPGNFQSLLGTYRLAEEKRKGARRARLGDTGHSKDRRADWLPERHKTPPLHYRWDVVHEMLEDLNGDVVR